MNFPYSSTSETPPDLGAVAAAIELVRRYLDHQLDTAERSALRRRCTRRASARLDRLRIIVEAVGRPTGGGVDA
jgi:hypothetical protein